MSSFDPQAPDWWKKAVFYQVYPRSFCDESGDGNGDIRGVISKLDYLKDLGIDAIWLSPVYRSPLVDNGYDISEYYDIDPVFGSMDDMDDLIREIHDRGMKLMMDLVVNHTSDQHPWFLESQSSLDNPKRDWYIWQDPKEGREPNNWASDFGGSAWTFHEETGQYYLHYFSPEQPDLNWDNPEVKDAVFAMMRWWLGKGVDGFRMDVVNFMKKPKGLPDAPRGEGDAREFIHGEELYANQPGMHELLYDMRKEVLDPYGAVTFGEMYFLSPERGLEYVAPDRGELDMLFEYQKVSERGNWPGIKYHTRVWHEAFSERGAWNTTALGNHDNPRILSMCGDAGGYEQELAKLIATYVLTSPGTPFIYQGDEIGMKNRYFESVDDFTDVKLKGLYHERVAEGQDPGKVLADLSWWSRDNARTPMQWHAGERAGFTSGEPWFGVNPNYTDINVTDQSNDPQSVLSYYKYMLSLRKSVDALSVGSYEPLRPDDWTVWAVKRVHGDEQIVVVFNFSLRDESIELPEELAHDPECLLSNYRDVPGLGERLELRPWEVRIYRI